MIQIQQSEAASKVASLSDTLKKCVEVFQKEMRDADTWEKSDYDALLSLSERLIDTSHALHTEIEDFYHWLHGLAGTTPGLTRPGSLI
ncbi:MAG: hypothetical protein IKZ87_00140 [Actinomycetaceae bacterium]|nr:hypothetical protein [Actinomycetaceae bacterium]